MQIQDGRYQAKVLGSAMGKAGNGKEQLGILLEITDGEAAGQSVTYYGYFTEKGWPVTERALQNLGWDPAENEFQLYRLHETDALLGRECSIVIENEMNPENGNVSTKVKWINAPGSGLALKDKMTVEEAAVFSATLRARVLQSRGPSAVKAPAGLSQAVQQKRAMATAPDDGASDDDIPF